jgi:hypothetical protein
MAILREHEALVARAFVGRHHRGITLQESCVGDASLNTYQTWT